MCKEIHLEFKNKLLDKHRGKKIIHYDDVLDKIRLPDVLYKMLLKQLHVMQTGKHTT